MKKQMQKSTVAGAVALAAVVGLSLLAYEAGWMSGRIRAAASARNDMDRAPMKKKASLLEAELHEDELQTCYQNFLRTEPKVDEGTVEVHWLLDKRGKISSMQMVHSDLEDDTFTKCLLERIKKMTFRPPPQAKPTLVAHKFKFHKRAIASLDFKPASEQSRSEE